MGGLRWRLLVVGLALCCAVAGGCGGDESADSEAGQILVRPGSPEEVAMTLAETIPDAVRKRDCEEVAEINARSRTRFLCPPLLGNSDGLRRFELTGSARFGVMRAVLDYRSKSVPDGATMILFRNADGEWAITRAGLLPRSEASSPDADRAERRAALERFLAAVRERDCDAWRDNAGAIHRDPQIVCREEFPSTRGLARLLAANAGVEPRYVGGSGSFGFFDWSIAKPEPRRFSFALVETAEGALRPYVVLDYAEGPVEVPQSSQPGAS